MADSGLPDGNDSLVFTGSTQHNSAGDNLGILGPSGPQANTFGTEDVGVAGREAAAVKPEGAEQSQQQVQASAQNVTVQKVGLNCSEESSESWRHALVTQEERSDHAEGANSLGGGGTAGVKRTVGNKSPPTEEHETKKRTETPSRSRQKRRQTAAAHSMEQPLSQLSNKGQELGELQTNLSQAQEKATLLENMLKEKEAEVARLRQMAQTRDGASAPSSTAVSEHELKQAYCNSVQSLKDYITMYNLMSYDITGKNLPDKITADLKTLIHQISKVCLQVIKPETPFVLELISKDYSKATITDWELDKGHWINVIAQLQLTDHQVLTILKSREQHVAKMMALYQERAVLARQAAEMAMRSATAGAAGTSGMLGSDDNSNMGVLMRHGYLYCARSLVAVHRVLECVKENLQREQKTVMELFLKVVYQILSPVQAALFVVESFPYHCDVLALSNVLSIVFGKEGVGSGDAGTSSGGMGNMGGAGVGSLGGAGRGMASGQLGAGSGLNSLGGGMSGSLGPGALGAGRGVGGVGQLGGGSGLGGPGGNNLPGNSIGGGLGNAGGGNGGMGAGRGIGGMTLGGGNGGNNMGGIGMPSGSGIGGGPMSSLPGGGMGGMGSNAMRGGNMPGNSNMSGNGLGGSGMGPMGSSMAGPGMSGPGGMGGGGPMPGGSGPNVLGGAGGMGNGMGGTSSLGGMGQGGFSGDNMGLGGGDADVMASWLQMQGMGGNGMDSIFDGPNMGGAGDDASGGAAAPDGINRLKKFLDSAGGALGPGGPNPTGSSGMGASGPMGGTPGAGGNRGLFSGMRSGNGGLMGNPMGMPSGQLGPGGMIPMDNAGGTGSGGMNQGGLMSGGGGMPGGPNNMRNGWNNGMMGQMPMMNDPGSSGMMGQGPGGGQQQGQMGMSNPMASSSGMGMGIGGMGGGPSGGYGSGMMQGMSGSGGMFPGMGGSSGLGGMGGNMMHMPGQGNPGMGDLSEGMGSLGSGAQQRMPASMLGRGNSGSMGGLDLSGPSIQRQDGGH